MVHQSHRWNRSLVSFSITVFFSTFFINFTYHLLNLYIKNRYKLDYKKKDDQKWYALCAENPSIFVCTISKFWLLINFKKLQNFIEKLNLRWKLKRKIMHNVTGLILIYSISFCSFVFIRQFSFNLIINKWVLNFKRLAQTFAIFCLRNSTFLSLIHLHLFYFSSSFRAISEFNEILNRIR